MDTSEYRHCGAELPVRVTKQGCQPRADIATMQSHCLNVTAEVSCAKGKNHYKRKQKNQYDYGLFLHTLGQAVCLADQRAFQRVLFGQSNMVTVFLDNI